MTSPKPTFTVRVDVTNPGQFFACCGLLELAHRLWPGAQAWFDFAMFHVLLPNGTDGTLKYLIEKLHGARLVSDDSNADEKTAPLRLGDGFDLRLDWWLDEASGSALKTWAGQQNVSRIANAMKKAVTPIIANGSIFDHSQVVYEPEQRNKSVEPFYFDARRFASALDIGFSLDTQNAETIAQPAVELLSLIGLQRFRPAQLPSKWCFEYWTWSLPLSIPTVAGVVSRVVPFTGSQRYPFQLSFRDNQKRYKAFGFATPIGGKI